MYSERPLVFYGAGKGAITEKPLIERHGVKGVCYSYRFIKSGCF